MAALSLKKPTILSPQRASVGQYPDKEVGETFIHSFIYSANIRSYLLMQGAE